MPVQYSYTSTPSMDRTACTQPQCLYSTAIPLFPCGPYGLYRASVPVQYSYNSTPPMDRTKCTEPQCLYSRGIPLLALWTVQPVQNLSACTVQIYLCYQYEPYGLNTAAVLVQYSSKTNTLMGRRDCTEPLCLYSTFEPLLILIIVRPLQSFSQSTVQL